jgi:seryl-tRNA synthetase
LRADKDKFIKTAPLLFARKNWKIILTMCKIKNMMWSILKPLRENPDVLIKSQEKRDGNIQLIEKAIEKDKEWRKLLKDVNDLRHQRNLMAAKIKSATKEEKQKIIMEAKKLSETVKVAENNLKNVEEELNTILLSIPNILHDSVPAGKDDTQNVPIKYWGKPKVYVEYVEDFDENVEFEIIEKKPCGHADAVEQSGWVDVERASKVSGSRFFYMLDDLVWLDFAIMMHAMDILGRNGFKIVNPPYMMKRKPYEGVTAFEDFEEVIYKIEDEDLYLIATSEHAIAAMHMDEVLEEGSLPLLYAGVSPCFRKEAGAHGKDTKGIFRVHQFNKVEQFVFCLPEQSWKWHEKMLKNAEVIMQQLGIPYRVVNICTGDIGIVAAKKYDIEVWMPSQGRYREIVSCSNCTDWQSYRLNIRYAEEKGKPSKGFVHTLNSTAIATSRAITAIIENFQLEDGRVEIPDVLKKYLETIEAAPLDYLEPKNSEKEQ